MWHMQGTRTHHSSGQNHEHWGRGPFVSKLLMGRLRGIAKGVLAGAVLWPSFPHPVLTTLSTPYST